MSKTIFVCGFIPDPGWFAQEKSFKNAQEYLDVVSQEFEAQGHVMEGPCARAMRAGLGGKHVGNTSRDLKRHYRQLHPDEATWFY